MARRDTEPTAPPRNDAYTGMLVISLGAMVLGSVLLFIDYSRYSEKKPADPSAPVKRENLTPVPVAPAEQPK